MSNTCYIFHILTNLIYRTQSLPNYIRVWLGITKAKNEIDLTSWRVKHYQIQLKCLDSKTRKKKKKNCHQYSRVPIHHHKFLNPLSRTRNKSFAWTKTNHIDFEKLSTDVKLWFDNDSIVCECFKNFLP